jgi:hypothetical protein
MTWNVPKMVEEGDKGSEPKSEDYDIWESKWLDFGGFPAIIPEFNVALAEFIIKQTGTKVIFPETLHQEGGI